MDILKDILRKNDTKILLVVLDGLGGLPHPEHGMKSELEVAHKPNLDDLARRAATGMTIPVDYGVTPGSGPAHLALFGYDPLEHIIGRGVLEALGIGFHMGKNDVAARGNFATLRDGVVVDRRAGRIPTTESSKIVSKLAEKIKKIEDVEVILRPGKEHRFVVIFRGPGLDDKVSDTDPEKVGVPPLKAHPTAETEGAKKLARIVNEFVRQALEIISDEPKANGILLRGFAKVPDITPFPEKFQLKSVAIAAYPMYKGLTRLVGMDTPDVGETFEDEIKALENLWNDYEFFYLHFKDTDKAGEDGDFKKKVDRIEYFDKFVPTILSLKPDVLVITGDHSTPSLIGGHSWHPNPTILYSRFSGLDDVDVFTEKACSRGYLGIFFAKHLMKLVLANAQRFTKFGA